MVGQEKKSRFTDEELASEFSPVEVRKLQRFTRQVAGIDNPLIREELISEYISTLRTRGQLDLGSQIERARATLENPLYRQLGSRASATEDVIRRYTWEIVDALIPDTVGLRVQLILVIYLTVACFIGVITLLFLRQWLWAIGLFLFWLFVLAPIKRYLDTEILARHIASWKVRFPDE